MACVGRTKECTIVPSNHYGPIPGVPVGTTWKFRVQVSFFLFFLLREAVKGISFICVCTQVSEAGVHRPHVGGIHGRSNDGSYSLVLAGGFEDEVVGFPHRIFSLMCCTQMCVLWWLIFRTGEMSSPTQAAEVVTSQETNESESTVLIKRWLTWTGMKINSLFHILKKKTFHFLV